MGVGEAARALDVHENSMRHWSRAGLLGPVVMSPGGQRSISRAGVQAMIAQRAAVNLTAAQERYRVARAELRAAVRQAQTLLGDDRDHS